MPNYKVTASGNAYVKSTYAVTADSPAEAQAKVEQGHDDVYTLEEEIIEKSDTDIEVEELEDKCDSSD